MNIQLTPEQRQQQALINGFITDLERRLQAGSPAAPVNADLGNMLNGLFGTFNKDQDQRFNASELASLTNHLKSVNTNQNIALLFKENGQVNFETTSTIDITGDGRFNGQEDLVALQQIIGSRTSTTPSSAAPNSSAPTSSASTSEVKSGTGNIPGGLRHFNANGAYFVTEGGFTVLTDVNAGGHTTQIYDRTGKMISRMWGDPHVDDDSTRAGDDWHFGDDSTFILPDGTEIMFNTESNKNNNVFITTGLYIKSGDDVYQTGQSFGTGTTGNTVNASRRNSGITKLDISGADFDAQHADAANDRNGAGVFAYSQDANAGRGGWAILTEGGVFKDVKHEWWSTYLANNGASFNGQYDGTVSVSKAQMVSALDGEAAKIFEELSNSPAGTGTVPGSNPPIRADDLFLQYYFQEGANTEELETFSTMISNGSSAQSFSVLDNYIRNGTATPLTDEQESKFLEYVSNPAAPGVAQTYLTLIENEASPEKFELLDNLARGEYTLNASQRETFFNFLVSFDNPRLAETYVGIIENGGNAASVQYLEDYATGELELDEPLTAAQEDQMLNYLGGSTNPNIAKSYVNLIQEGASERKLEILDDIFEGSGSLSQEVDAEDLRFADNLDLLRTQFNVSADTSEVLENLSIANIDKLNQVVDRMLANNRDAAPSDARNIKTDTNSLYSDLISVLTDPLVRIETDYSRTPSRAALGDILELQLASLDTLEDSGQNVDEIRAFTENRLNSIRDVDGPGDGPYTPEEQVRYDAMVAKLDLLVGQKNLAIPDNGRDFLSNLDADNIDDVDQILQSMIDAYNDPNNNQRRVGIEMRELYKTMVSVFSDPLQTISNPYATQMSQDVFGGILALQLSLINERITDLGATPESPTFNVTIDGSYNTSDITKMKINALDGMIDLYESQIAAENAKTDPNESNIANWQAQITANQANRDALLSTVR